MRHVSGKHCEQIKNKGKPIPVASHKPSMQVFRIIRAHPGSDESIPGLKDCFTSGPFGYECIKLSRSDGAAWHRKIRDQGMCFPALGVSTPDLGYGEFFCVQVFCVPAVLFDRAIADRTKKSGKTWICYEVFVIFFRYE